MEEFSKEQNREIKISADAIDVIADCSFPGNVRELENCLQRAAVMAKDSVVRIENLPCSGGRCHSHVMHVAQARNQQAVEQQMQANYPSNPLLVPKFAPTGSTSVGTNPPIPNDLLSISNERDRVIAALERTGWVQAKAARLLNMTPRQISYRLKKLNIPLHKI